MTEAFTLDTSGAVEMPPLRWGGDTYAKYWLDLDAFTQGYIEAALSSPDLHNSAQLRAGYRAIGFSDLAPEALVRTIADCAAEQREPTPAGTNMQGEGRAFWSLRSQGVYPKWSPLTPRLGDDGKVYLREAGQ